MVTRCKEIRNAPVGRDSIDQIDKTPIPLARIAAIDDGIAGLKDKLDGSVARGEPFYRREHRIDDQRMFVLLCGPVAAATRIAVDQK